MGVGAARLGQIGEVLFSLYWCPDHSCSGGRRGGICGGACCFRITRWALSETLEYFKSGGLR